LVDRADVASLLLEHFGIRVEREMSDYLPKQLSAAGRARELHVMGGDARTGVPRRLRLPPIDQLRASIPKSVSPHIPS